MRGITTAFAFLLMVSGVASAQTTAPAAVDNPFSGLTIDGTNASPANPGQDTQTFLEKFKGHLDVLNGANLKPADPSTLEDIKYVAFYYSASWCSPCRSFTPRLVEFYNSFKSRHPNFELIFVDRDEDADSMLNYMVNDKMPWPAVHFSDIDSPRLRAREFAGPGIPCLVLVDDQGRVLADSYVNGEYVGPYQVMNQIQSLVPAVSPEIGRREASN